MALQGVRDGRDAERSFDLTRDLPALEAAVTSTDQCRLVIVDPVTCYLGDTDAHKNAEVRAALKLLSDMAAKYRVAVVCVSHLNKNSAGPAIYRTSGSLAFVAAARSAWCVSKAPDNPQRRLVLPIKNNIGNDSTGLAYAIMDGVVCWEAEAVTTTADEALGAALNPKKNEHRKVDDAAGWLAQRLQNGPVGASDIEAEAEAAGFSKSTLRRAAEQIEVVKNKVGGGGWEWSRNQDAQLSTLDTLSTLPQNEQKTPCFLEDAQGAQDAQLSTLLDVEHLAGTENEWGAYDDERGNSEAGVCRRDDRGPGVVRRVGPAGCANGCRRLDAALSATVRGIGRDGRADAALKAGAAGVCPRSDGTG